MQKKILVGVAVVAVLSVFASALLLQRLRAARESEKSKEAVLQAEAATRAEQERRVAELQRDQARLGQQNEELANLAQSLRASEAKQGSNAAALAKRLSASATNAPGGAGQDGSSDANSRNPLATMVEKMMKDPAMREMVRSQQKVTMQQMYGPLFKELALAPDEKQKFMDILLDNAMNGMENAGAMFKGEGTERSEALKAIGDQQKDMNAGIKALLGDEKFAQYEDYQKTIGERTQLNQFKQQLETGGASLEDAQYAQMLQIFKEEKARTPPVISSDPNQSGEALKALASEETMNKQFQWQEDLNKRVLGRAGEVLTPGQMKEYADFQNQQLSMQKMAMKMAREMFGADSAKPNDRIEVQTVPTTAK